MATEVNIVNLALIRLGATTISTMTESTRNAQAAEAIYDLIRQELLREHAWNFATKRQDLNEADDYDDISTQWDYAYDLPDDCLRALLVNDDKSVAFEVTDDGLLCNDDEVELKYIKDEDDPTKFSTEFVNLLAMRMAAELAMPITGSVKKATSMWQLYGMFLANSKTHDAQEAFDNADDTNIYRDARR